MKTDIFEPQDKEEKDLIEEIEKDNFESVPNVKEEIAKAQAIAKNTLTKNKNICLPQNHHSRCSVQL